MLLFGFKKFTSSIVLIGGISIAMAAIAESLLFSNPEMLSEYGSANKTKLVRMGNGWLVSVYGDAAGPAVYDTKADAQRLARDIFVTVCHPAFSETQCSFVGDEFSLPGDDWSAPINLSKNAHLSSIATDWNELDDTGPTPFYGDSGKPNIFVAGNFAVVSWTDKYCLGGAQRMISYTEREGITVPFSCLYMAYTNNVAGLDGPPLWHTVQLTDGERDAKSDFNKGVVVDTLVGDETVKIAKWAWSWQEDPHGLQIGGADGPGEGASGAAVTHGTDIWYTYTPDLLNVALAAPVRISDNYTNDGEGGNTSPIFHPDDPLNEITILERGNTGAARPNLMLVGGSPTPTAVIAYEESKGAERLDSGKFIRYHEFAFDSPPPESEVPYENGEPGCLISDPLENSRRVRFVSQKSASPNGLRMGVFWRQGLPTEGGPGDIMVRFGNKNTSDAFSTGLRPEDMVPAVDTNCRVSDFAVARLLVNTRAYNISSNTIPWSPVELSKFVRANDLEDATDINPYEDARAHRAAIVGDDFYIGYSYAKDWALATYTNLDNYNFWLRHYNAALGGTWTDAKNLSNILPAEKMHVKEPRLVKTPGTGMGCTDPENIKYPENCQNKSTFIVAWGTETNVYSHVDKSVEGDISYTRTTDKGVTFEEPAVLVPGIVVDPGDPLSDPPVPPVYNNRFESQLRPSPAGNILWSVWNEADNTSLGGTHAMLSVSDESIGTPPTPPAGDVTPLTSPGIIGGVIPPVGVYDLSLDLFQAPNKVKVLTSRNFNSFIRNIGPDVSAEGTLTIRGYVDEDDIAEFTLGGDDGGGTFGPIAMGDSVRVVIPWISPPEPMEIHWVAEIVSTGDNNGLNDTQYGTTTVK